MARWSTCGSRWGRDKGVADDVEAAEDMDVGRGGKGALGFAGKGRLSVWLRATVA